LKKHKMHKPPKSKYTANVGFPKKDFFTEIASYIESIQLKSGAIPSNEDGSHDPWDHIESIMGLSFANKLDSAKLAFQWLIENQNIDGSWYAKYDDLKPIERNKPTHFAPYIAVAALHIYKISHDKEFLKKLWPTVESAINFSTKLQITNGTIPWSIDSEGVLEEDYLLTGSSSILKSIECGLAISKILDNQKNIRNWIMCYDLLTDAIRNPSGKFDLLKDRKRFSMDWYYPILSGCLNMDEKIFYIQKVYKDFYIEKIGIKCVVDEPWITVAETSEFIISLMIYNDEHSARKMLYDIINISDQNGIPYMGWQYEENIFWPKEKPSWTSAALIIAADTVLNYSDASDLFLKNQSILY
tara:strand:+ start:448 stop:1518 length:1071 start_codon:yes stop_codon:yes gene_type:complete